MLSNRRYGVRFSLCLCACVVAFCLALSATLAQTKPAPQPPPDESALVAPQGKPLAAITALAFSPDGKRLAVGTYGQVVLYDTDSWQVAGMFRQVEDSVRALAFHPEGKVLAIGCGLPGRTGKVILWDTTGGQPPHACAPQQDTIEAVCFRPDGKALLVGADDNKVRYFAQLPSDDSTVLDEHNGRVQAVAFSSKPDFIFVTGAMDKIVKVWDVKTRKTVVNFDQSEGGITGLEFLPNGVQFVGASLDGRLLWWGVNYDEKKQTYNGYIYRGVGAHNGGVYCLGMSGNKQRLISGGADHNVCIWNADNGGQIRLFKDLPQPVYAVALNQDGKLAAGAGRDGWVRIWDVEGNKLVQAVSPPPLPAPPAPKPAVKPSTSHAKHPVKKRR